MLALIISLLSWIGMLAEYWLMAGFLGARLTLLQAIIALTAAARRVPLAAAGRAGCAGGQPGAGDERPGVRRGVGRQPGAADPRARYALRRDRVGLGRSGDSTVALKPKTV